MYQTCNLKANLAVQWDIYQPDLTCLLRIRVGDSALCRAVASRRPDDGEVYNSATGCVNSAITAQPDRSECAQPPVPHAQFDTCFRWTHAPNNRRAEEEERGRGRSRSDLPIKLPVDAARVSSRVA